MKECKYTNIVLIALFLLIVFLLLYLLSQVQQANANLISINGVLQEWQLVN